MGERVSLEVTNTSALGFLMGNDSFKKTCLWKISSTVSLSSKHRGVGVQYGGLEERHMTLFWGKVLFGTGGAFSRA